MQKTNQDFIDEQNVLIDHWIEENGLTSLSEEQLVAYSYATGTPNGAGPREDDKAINGLLMKAIRDKCYKAFLAGIEYSRKK